MKRRSFLQGSLAAAVAACTTRISGGLGANGRIGTGTQPNILVIMVDEMRFPYGPNAWIPQAAQQAFLPNLYALWQKSACFYNHYTAAIMCSPARSSLITGLYGHQHMMMSTLTNSNEPALQTAFPTWGSALKADKYGYDRLWFGKFHLTPPGAPVPLGDYGFEGTILDDPDGTPGQGLRRDPQISQLFVDWITARGGACGSGSGSASGATPFCTTVSFVNPHDIAEFYRLSDCAGEAGPYGNYGNFLDASYFNFGTSGHDSVPNFANPFTDKTKPSLQAYYAAGLAGVDGPISYDVSTYNQAASTACANGLGAQPFSEWYKLLRCYFWLHTKVDLEIGKVLDALACSPYAENTIVIFTADHGEYGGAHGLRMKGCAAYEETLKIPLTIYDPTGTYIPDPEVPRMGLTSSVDIMPLLLTLASEDPSQPTWAGDYPYLTLRHDLLPMMQSGTAPGRDHILHTTDEMVPVGNTTPPPFHIIAMRTQNSKFATYSNWLDQTAVINPVGQEQELYDYNETNGILEQHNLANTPAGRSLQTTYMQALFGPNGLVATELRAPLPPALEQAQQVALQEYWANLDGG